MTRVLNVRQTSVENGSTPDSGCTGLGESKGGGRGRSWGAGMEDSRRDFLMDPALGPLTSCWTPAGATFTCFRGKLSARAWTRRWGAWETWQGLKVLVYNFLEACSPPAARLCLPQRCFCGRQAPTTQGFNQFICAAKCGGLSACEFVCMRASVCVIFNACMCVYLRGCISVSVCLCLFTWVWCVCTYVCLFVCVWPGGKCVCVYVCTCTCVCLCVCVREACALCMCMFVRVCVYVRMCICARASVNCVRLHVCVECQWLSCARASVCVCT